MLKKAFLAFILGLILFLSWGHPAFATVVVPAPVRPLIVNPNISGGLLAPTAPAPLATRPPLQFLPVPFTVGQPYRNPFIEAGLAPPYCALTVLGAKLDGDMGEAWKRERGTPYFGNLVVGTVPDKYDGIKAVEAYEKYPSLLTYLDQEHAGGFYGTLRNARPGRTYYLGEPEVFCGDTSCYFYKYVLMSLISDPDSTYRVQSLSYQSPYTLEKYPPLPGCEGTTEEEEEQKCDSRGLFNCLTKVLSEKFPFDVFGAIPDDRGGTCPNFKLFNKDFDFCWLYQLVSYIRYPICLGLLIKVVLHL